MWFSRNAALLAGALVALAGTACNTISTEQPELWGQDVPLTILHTSDIHSRILPYDFQPSKTDRDLGLLTEAPPYGGVSRLAAMIERERSRAQRSIHVDSGDCFQGAPIFNANNGEVEQRWMSQVRPDAVVVGNHEFDAGVVNYAKQVEAWATYPVLAANYDWYDWRDPRFTELGRLTQPFTITNVGGLRVAVIGMANISSLNSIGEDGNSIQVAPMEQNETARAFVEMLSPLVDLVGVVSHLGLEEDKDLVEGYVATYKKEQIASFLTRKHDPWTVVEELGDGLVRVRIPGVRNLDFIAGGHLHIVTAPPQLVTDPDGRKVILFHSGAFAKYLGRLDLVVRMPEKEAYESDPLVKYRGGEIQAHEYYALPVDSVWCKDHRTTPELLPDALFEDREAFVKEARYECAKLEDGKTLKLLDDYNLDLARRFDLQRIFAYAPREILRRSSSTGGDAPLGNMTAEAMRARRRVEAEFALTNTLGIRDSLYRGPITIESMFNVFPFENTINIMYLSGDEIQEMLDFVASRSSGRGCQSQAQIAGLRFTMDCAQSQRNYEHRSCSAPSDCLRDGEPSIDWQCNENECFAHPAQDIRLGGQPVGATAVYKLATNDYVAKGGSGFSVLKRNTTRSETGISLRDALIEYMRDRFCSCSDLLKPDAAALCPANTVAVGGERVVDDLAVAFCETASDFRALLEQTAGINPKERDELLLAAEAPKVYAGKCDCNDVLVSDEAHREAACGHVTPELEQFCKDPISVPVVTGVEDDRISRRLQ